MVDNHLYILHFFLIVDNYQHLSLLLELHAIFSAMFSEIVFTRKRLKLGIFSAGDSFAEKMSQNSSLKIRQGKLNTFENKHYVGDLRF